MLSIGFTKIAFKVGHRGYGDTENLKCDCQGSLPKASMIEKLERSWERGKRLGLHR